MFDWVSCWNIIDNKISSILSPESEKNPSMNLLWVSGSGQRHYNEFDSDSSDAEDPPIQNPSLEYKNAIRIFTV